MALNHVNISGNLGADAELRTTQGGMAILSFRVAVNERRKDQSGEWSDYTNWVGCSMFGKRAESIAQYLTKGTKVACSGKLRWSQWEDRNTGEKRSKLEVIVDDIEFMSSRQQGGYQQAPQMAPRAAQRPQFQPQNANGYQSASQQQMAPQMAPQQGYVAAPGVYQPAIQQPMQQQVQQDDLYQDDIPF